MSAFRDALARGRQQLNPLATSLPLQPSHPTPQSAVSNLSTPFGYYPGPYTPSSAVRQYNPQQWGPSAVGPENGVRYAPGSDGVEVSAPPPYSPPRSNRPVTASPEEATPPHGTSPAHVMSPSHGMSPAHHMSPGPIHRPSPEPTSTPIFPPPPGASRTRAMSRDRPTNIFGFGRRQTGHETDLAAQREHGGHALRPLQINTELQHSTEEAGNLSAGGRPPAARRAASTGAIETPTYSQSQSFVNARWDNGMPIPPPPPCPPPHAQPRSQSMTRTPDTIMSPPTRRPPPASTLGPVPPTPADWREEDAVANLRGKSPNRGLQIDTAGAAATPPPAEVNSGATSGGSSGLSRTPAVRGEPRSIRERRSESRTAQRIGMEEPSHTLTDASGASVTPSNITVVAIAGRRPAPTKSTPRSARNHQGADVPTSAKSAGHGTPTVVQQDGTESRGLTPRTTSSAKNNLESPTPPFSPNHSATFQRDAHHIPPRSLPTPPPQTRRSGSPRPRAIPSPTADGNATNPNSPAKRISAPLNAGVYSSDFINDAILRHNEFAQKEAAAVDDEERVRLFADFVVSESRLRREHYAAAIDAMGSEILELTRDLFRPYSKAERASLRRASDRGDRAGIQIDSAQNSRPGSSASSIVSPSLPIPQGESAHYINGYKPSLSPIASMAASDNPDESSSRGRPPSRWWEANPETPGSGLGRSKRESKYMGVPKEARELLQWEGSGPSSNAPTVAGPSSQRSWGPDEYPPEKAGWHDDASSGPNAKTPTSAAFRPYSPVLPSTPNPKHLDVSRLVTLPPPYPRHHPAVNNNHPDLTNIRDAVRELSDFAVVQATKEQFNAKNRELKQDAADAAAQRKQSLRAKISTEIAAGTMTYADAAKAEAESASAEADNSKAQSKTFFELFQTSVVGPLNDLFMDRIHQSTTLFEQLRGQLFVDAQQQNPNMPQEEGDEQPELLEKLTLLKWIFEARESLHRELYDLLTDRNDQYRDMVIEPYRLAGNDAKVANAEAFFASDGRKRALEYESQSLTRTVEFMDVVETNVIRGVEVQLGAFWDIAPNLRQIIEKVPKQLTWDFGIVIPREEYEDNPEYAQYPLQYLYHLLEHGEKSTYQFIESQINLLCLLHEVKNAMAAVRGRVDKAEAASQGRDGEADTNAIKEGMESEERRLTEDLKEKVRCVEELWNSGIGVEFGSVKERVKEFLVEEGGWEGVENAI